LNQHARIATTYVVLNILAARPQNVKGQVSNSQYAKTGDAFGEKAIAVKLVKITNNALDNLSGR
jgi:hypothetical protein